MNRSSIIILLLLSIIASLFSQQTDVFIASQYVDRVDLFRMENNSLGSVYTRRPFLSPNNYDAWYSIYDEIDGTYSSLRTYDFNSGTSDTIKFISDSNLVDIVNYNYYNTFSEQVLLSKWSYSDVDDFEYLLLVVEDDEIEEYELLNSDIGVIKILGYSSTSNCYYGVATLLNNTVHPFVLSSDFQSLKLDTLVEVASFPFHQFYENSYTEELILIDGTYTKYSYNYELDLLNICELETQVWLPRNNTIYISDSLSLSGGKIDAYYNVNFTFYDQEVILINSNVDCSYDTLYSYVPPDSAEIYISEFGFDGIYKDYLYNSVFYKSDNLCVLPLINGCTTIFSVTSLSSDGNMNWKQFIGGDAYYRPMYTIATEDSGVLVLLGTQNIIDNDNEIDTHYIKFDKYGNQETDFFSPFLSTSLPEIQITNALVYPNPTSDYLYIQSGRPSTSNQIQIFDMAGKMIRCEEIDMSARLDLRELSSGAYTFMLEDDKGELKSGKFVKE